MDPRVFLPHITISYYKLFWFAYTCDNWTICFLSPLCVCSVWLFRMREMSASVVFVYFLDRALMIWEMHAAFGSQLWASFTLEVYMKMCFSSKSFFSFFSLLVTFWGYCKSVLGDGFPMRISLVFLPLWNNSPCGRFLGSFSLYGSHFTHRFWYLDLHYMLSGVG